MKFLKKKKINFKISKRQVAFKPHVPISQDQINYDMTPTQKLDYYKKQKIRLKYKQKYEVKQAIQLYQKLTKMKKSNIPNMLNNLNQSMKKQPTLLFDQQIKHSEQKLKFFRSHGKDKLDNTLKESRQTSSSPDHRCRFFSLKNGKPEKKDEFFPSFEQYVEGKNREKLQQKYYFNIKKIEKNLSELYRQSQEHEQDQDSTIVKSSLMPLNLTQRDRKSNNNSRASRLSNSLNIGSLKAQNTPSKRSSLNTADQLPKTSQKIEIPLKESLKFGNLFKSSDIFIHKSQSSSKSIVKTMTGFYDSRNLKKREYNNMIQYYNHDRPLTNEIRRNEYDILGDSCILQLNSERSNQPSSPVIDAPRRSSILLTTFRSPEKSQKSQKMKEIAFYRNKSQKQRIKILQKNSSIYFKILDALSKYHEDDIPISVQFLKQLRQLMKKQYFFTQFQIEQVLSQIKQRMKDLIQARKGDMQSSLISNSSNLSNPEQKQEIDFMIKKVIEIINKQYGWAVEWDKC